MRLLEKIKSYFVDPAERQQSLTPSKGRMTQFVARCEGESEGFFLAGESLRGESLTFRTQRALLPGEEVRLDVLLPTHGLLKIHGHVDSIKSGLGGFRGEMKLHIPPHQRVPWETFCHEESSLRA